MCSLFFNFIEMNNEPIIQKTNKRLEPVTVMVGDNQSMNESSALLSLKNELKIGGMRHQMRHSRIVIYFK